MPYPPQLKSESSHLIAGGEWGLFFYTQGEPGVDDLLIVYFGLDTVYEIDYSINHDMRDATSYHNWYGKAERRLAVRTDERN